MSTGYYEPPLYQRQLATIPGSRWAILVEVRHRSGGYAVIVALGSGGSIVHTCRSKTEALSVARAVNLNTNLNQQQEVA